MDINIRIHEDALFMQHEFALGSLGAFAPYRYAPGSFALVAEICGRPVGAISLFNYAPGELSVLHEMTRGRFPGAVDVLSADLALDFIHTVHRRSGLRELLYTLATDIAQSLAVERLCCLARPILSDANFLMKHLGFVSQAPCQLYRSHRGQEYSMGLVNNPAAVFEQIDAERNRLARRLTSAGFETYFEADIPTAFAPTEGSLS